MEVMKQFTNITEALAVFESNAKVHTYATENGNYKEANRAYDRIKEAVAFLDEQGGRTELLSLIDSDDVGTRMWAAAHLLPTKFQDEGLRILDIIGMGSGITSSDARTTLQEWRRGNLRL